MISMTNLVKKFANKVAVNELNLEIKSGEIFAFLGPNGAGKTTTIKMLVGLLQPTSGEIKICNIDVSKEPLQSKKNIAYVPDQPYLYDKLTGREFLYFIAQMYNISGKELENMVDRFIEAFEMKDYIDELTENYSHGMKQRVVFSSALVHSPKVIIVDEPMVGLDPKSAKLVKTLLKEQASKNVTVFMSTHTLEVAEEIADNIGIINMGKLIELGSFDYLKEKVSQESRLEGIFLSLTEKGN